jgi:hypothetical protein
MKPHINVLIATPGRSFENEYVTSLVDTIAYLVKNDITYRFLNQYSSQVNMAREATAMGSMYLDAFNKEVLRGEVTYDKIIWIDSDISWKVEDFIKIYESDKDVVSGVYLNEKGVPMFSTLSEEISPFLMLLSETQFPIAAAGFGFIGIKSGIFESIPRPWFDLVFQKLENEAGEEMLIPYGEDYSWCTKAKKAGYEIFLDPSVLVNHHKKTAIEPSTLIEMIKSEKAKHEPEATL